MAKKGLLIHHWDTDGICSAVILLKELPKMGLDREWDLFTPRLGNYFLTEEELGAIKGGGFSEIVIADMAIPSEQVEDIAGTVDHLYHFDHHIQDPHTLDNITHVNPVSQGAEQEDFPACTYVLKKHFKRELDLPTVLGLVGDVENRLPSYDKVYPEVEAYLLARGLSLVDLMRMCELIDANYKTDDQEAVKEAVPRLIDAGEDPGEILYNKEWQRKAKALQTEIMYTARRKFKELGGKLMLEIETTSHIISTIGRRAFREKGRPVVIINRGFEHMDQIYARGSNMTEAIKYCKGFGLRAGGKKDVVGVILPKGKLDGFLTDFLKKVPDKVLLK